MMEFLRVLAWPRKGISFWRDCRAGAAAEMALVLPSIAFIALNVADLGIYAYSRMQVDLAAQEAVGAARVLCNTSTTDRELPAQQFCLGLDPAIVAAAQNTTLGSRVSLAVASGIHSSEAYYCADNVTGTLKPNNGYPITSAPPADCSGVVSGSTIAPGDYISATASYSFAPLFPGISVASLLPSTITRTAWMRLK
jgi:Flp pilus assembly protein TadG